MSSPEGNRQRIQAEASAWLARLRADDVTEAERKAFQAWVAERPEHAQCFEALNNIWESVGAIGRDLRGHRRQEKAGRTRRQVFSGMALALVGGGAFAYWQSAAAEVYQTDIGEQRHIVLKNGCQVFLDADTRLVVQPGSPGSATLVSGCANFRVAADDSRPFTIKVGEQVAAASHSNMDIGQDGNQVSVLVFEGEATVNDALGYGVHRLSAGQRFLRSGMAPAVIDQPPMGPLLAWHNGQAVFSNDRLADAARQMNRYSAVKLIIADAATGNARISGTYSVGDNFSFANSISKLLPVKTIYSEKGIVMADYPSQ